MKSEDKLIAAFEAGEIDGADFPHERHVRVAWALAQRYPRDEAFERLASGLRGIAARAGRPDAYHETITRAWFELITAADHPEQHPELFDKTLLSRYYTPDRLAAGRDEWLEPDLHSLGLPPPPAAPDDADLRALLRSVPTAVAVIACRADEGVHATTVSSLTSVSRRPALVSVCLENRSRTLGLVEAAKSFAISLLASDQEEVAKRFAELGRSAGPAQFAGVPHHLSAFGPVIETAAATLGCRLHALHPCGDHHILVGEVELVRTSERRPLLRHDGRYD